MKSPKLKTNNFDYVKNKLRQSLLFLSFFLGIISLAKAVTPMSGTYTIDKSGSGASNFKSFKAAVTSLVNNGVSGSVLFNVSDETYTEQVTITGISGVSSSNTITFQSANGDSSKVILTQASSTSSSSNFTLYLNGCSYVTFNKITIRRTGTSTYGSVIQIDGASSNNAFTHCAFKGVKLSSGGTSDQSIIYSGISTDESNTFVQNQFKYGAYGFYWMGVYAAHENYNIIQDNLIDSATQCGIYSIFEDSFSIIHNTISNILSSSGYGIYLKYYYNSNFRKNIINMPSGGTGIFADYAFVFGGTDSTFFANNMISMGGSTSIGIYIFYIQGGYANFYDNSILLTSTNGTSSTAIWLDEQYWTNVFGNIFDNRGKGYAMYINHTGRTIFNEDFNDLYSNGSYIGYFAGTSVTTLAHWRTVTQYDSNSISTDAPFVSNSDLHLSSGLLRNGEPLYCISDDLDGDARTILPNLGADEVAPLSLDARITTIDTPASNFCAGSQNIVVTLTNVGTTSLTSAKISWKVNSASTISYSWTGSLAYGSSAVVNIGSYTFSKDSTYNMIVYCSSPNGGTDGNPADDTLKRTNFVTSLNGTYTVGGTTYDYATFSDAITDVTTKGICGPVIFNVANGTYNEQIEIGIIDGSSSANKITFQSASGDSTKVTLYASSTLAKNYVVHLGGGSYINFNKMTIKSTGSTYGVVLRVDGGSNYNTFSNNRIIGVKTTSDSTYLSNVYSGSTSVDGNSFLRNSFKYGSYDFFWTASFGKFDAHTFIQDNTMDSANYCGIFTQYQDSLTILHNTITNIKSSGYGIDIYAFGASNILGNIITMPNGGYGIYSDYPYLLSTPFDSNTFANNMISMGGKYSTGLYADYGYAQYINIYYNSILMQSTNLTYSYAVEVNSFTATPNIKLYNNIMDNEGSGYALYLGYSNYGIASSDFNDLFSKGSYIGYSNYINYSSLSSWQSGTTWDKNSVSKAASFMSKSDLHLKKAGGLQNGVSLTAITNDLDGQTRGTPSYIGADEMGPSGLDIGVASIDSPGLSLCSGTQDIVVTLANSGASTVTSATIKWQINTGGWSSYSWTGSLSAGSKTSIKLGTYTFTKGTTYNITAYSSSPNGGIDSVTSNDTSSKSNLVVALNGKYTIGGPGHDFSNFTKAVEYLKANGVCGQVIFNVADSTYKEQIEIDNINGTSSSNTITFQSKSGDSSRVRLTYPSGTTNNYTLYLNAANYIKFKKITIARTGTDYYSVVVEIDGGSNFDTFSHNRFIGVNSTSGATSQAIIYSTSLTNSGNGFIQNSFKYGAYDFYLYGSYTGYDAHNLIKDNNMDSAYYYGVYGMYQDSIAILHNRITNILNTFGGYGIYLNYYGNSNVSKNTIIMPNNGYGINAGTATLTTGDSSFFTNNMISMGGTASIGMYSYSGTKQFVNFYDNTVLMQKTNGTGSYAVQIESYNAAANVNLYDNIFDNRGSGYSIYVTYKNYGIYSSDFNALYTNGSSLGYIGGSAIATLADWKSSSGFDANSINTDPSFVSSKDLHLSTTSLKNGVALYSITDDIDGQTRRTSSSTNIGADEIFPTDDIGITAILSPADKSCMDSNATVKVIVKNFGTSSQSGFTSYFTMNGNAPISATYSKTLASGASDTLIFANKVNTTAGGTFSLKSYTGLSGDLDHSDDTFMTSISVSSKPNASFSYSTIGTTGKTVRFEPADSSGSLRYNWAFGDGNSDTVKIHPVHSYASKTVFVAKLTVRSAQGCTNTSTDTVDLTVTGLDFTSQSGFKADLYPNPFTNIINIAYTLEKESFMKITVYDMFGKSVSTLVDNSSQLPGNYSYKFDATTNNLKAGIYIIQFRMNDTVIEKRIIKVN